jgi:alkanesulfonate monooxygenase SsuD/methylene tetrahydromethanopterin reductase-like flavin-dependent oxidoreductase (luciferase family)
MLRLAARYADSWNTAWHAEPSSAVPRIESIREACKLERRDPDTFEITASVGIGYPDLGAVTPRSKLTGTPEQVAEAFRGYAELGVKHIMIEFAPYTTEALDRVTSAVRLFGGG